MSEKVIDGLSGYVEEVCLLRKTLRHVAPVCYDELLFRGHSDKTHRIIPFLGRNRDSECSNTLFNHEHNMIAAARYKRPDIFHNNLFPVELLALLQHYGVNADLKL